MGITYIAPHWHYAGVVAEYSGATVNANVIYVTGAAVFDGHLVVSLLDGKSTHVRNGVYRVNAADLAAWVSHYLPTPVASYYYPYGCIATRDGGTLYVGWGNAQFQDTVYTIVTKYTAGGGTAATSVATLPYSGVGFYGLAIRELDPECTLIWQGKTNGSGAGDRWDYVDTATGTTGTRTFNTEGGHAAHDGQGQSIVEFDGKWYWSGANDSNGSDIPIWRTATLAGAYEAWEHTDAALQTTLTGRMSPATNVSNVLLVRTSNSSATKRMYAFVRMANKLAYITAGGGAWSTVNLPSGEYLPHHVCTLHPTDDGKVYFVTSTASALNPTFGGVLRVRSVDEAGNFELIGTLPISAVMFVGYTLTSLGVFDLAPRWEGGVVRSLIAAVIGNQGGSGGATYGDPYIVEFPVTPVYPRQALSDVSGVVLLVHGDTATGDPGGPFIDSSSYAGTLTADGTPRHTTVGRAGQDAVGEFALYFDGSDRLTLPDAPRWDIDGPFTMQAWIKPTQRSTAQWVLSQWSDVSNTRNVFLFGTYAGGEVAFNWMLYGTGSQVGVQSTDVAPVGEWTHICVTYDGATIRLFVNGVLQPNTGTYTNVWRTSYEGVCIGASYTSGAYNQSFVGLLEEVYWNNDTCEHTTSFTPTGWAS